KQHAISHAAFLRFENASEAVVVHFIDAELAGHFLPRSQYSIAQVLSQWTRSGGLRGCPAHNAIAPGALGFVKTIVGALQHAFSGVVRQFGACNADRRRDLQRMINTMNDEGRRADVAAQALSRQTRDVARGARHDYHEFFPAKPTSEVR